MEVRVPAVGTGGMLCRHRVESVLWAQGQGWGCYSTQQCCWSVDGMGFTPHLHPAASLELIIPKYISKARVKTGGNE